MRKSIVLKTLLRSPFKAILTFLLIAAASFALFSRVTDYAITMREITEAKSFCKGVAALDNTVPYITLDGGGAGGGIGDDIMVQTEEEYWPTAEEMQGFLSLPGITLADIRYETAGRVEDYRRLVDEEITWAFRGRVVMEGSYMGYQDDLGDFMHLLFEDVTVLASDDDKLDLFYEQPVEVLAISPKREMTYRKHPFSMEELDALKKGTRCLVMANYNDTQGIELTYTEESFWVIEGLGEDYLETEAFTVPRERMEAIEQSRYTYDIVYTSDMRSIPRFNEHNMVIAEGRPLTEGDTDVCVVDKLFLDTYGLSIGDRISIALGDKLFPVGSSAKPEGAKDMSGFGDTAELEIVGAYQTVDDVWTRTGESEWCYTNNTIFVPSALLPVEAPDDYRPTMNGFSVLIEDPDDIEAFLQAAEPYAADMGLKLRFSDGGWLSMKDSFEMGRRTAFLTAVLSVAGAALALFLAAYLYIGRNKEAYAIMRTLGVPSRKAKDAAVLPLVLLSVLAMPAGGAAGLSYTSHRAASALQGMAGDAPYGYIPDAALPVGVAILCLVLELAYVSCATLLFLRNMERRPPLALLQEGTVRMAAKEAQGFLDPAPALTGLDATKLSAASGMEPGSGRPYGAARHVTAYILRHMRRGIGKAVLSLVLAAALAAGVGMLVLARLAYWEASQEVEVKGSALKYSFASAAELSKSPLVKDFYCCTVFGIRINGQERIVPMTLTNDIGRSVSGSGTVSYAEGLDASSLGDFGRMCLMGQKAAEAFGVRPGDSIALLPDALYVALAQTFCEDEKELLAAVERETETYHVAGVIDSEDSGVANGVFAVANSAAEYVFGNLFSFERCEFVLAENGKLDELIALLEEQKARGKMQAPMASYFVDSAGYGNIRRICGLLDALFPITVAAAVLIGLLGPGLAIMQSAQEAAFLRILGVTKKRARCMLLFEQIFLCAAGIAAVAGGLSLYSPGLFVRSAGTLAACWALYLSGCICGALAASVRVTRHRILRLLQVKE